MTPSTDILQLDPNPITLSVSDPEVLVGVDNAENRGVSARLLADIPRVYALQFQLRWEVPHLLHASALRLHHAALAGEMLLELSGLEMLLELLGLEMSLGEEAACALP